MKKSIKVWTIAFAVAAPVAAILAVCAIRMGEWLPRQNWFVDLIL